MKRSLIKLLLPALVCATTSLASAAPFVIFDTGVDASGNPLTPTAGYPAGQVNDPHWTVTASPLGAFTPVTIPAGFPIQDAGNPARPWVANNLNPGGSRWIGPSNFTATAPPGNYTYETTFNLTNFLPGTATINGSWAADNGAEMYLNGTLVNTLVLNTFSAFTAFTIPQGSNFIAGVNTLRIIVINTTASNSPTGLHMTALLGDAIQVPELSPSRAAIPLAFMFFAVAFCLDRRRQQASVRT